MRSVQLCSLMVWLSSCGGTQQSSPEPVLDQPSGLPEVSSEEEPASGGEDPAAMAEEGREAEGEEERFTGPEPESVWVMPERPLSLADGRLQIYDLYLYPEDSLMWEAMGGVLDAWTDCVAAHPEACGHQVFQISSDRHRLGYSQSWYVDQLQGEVERCIAQGAESFRMSPSVPTGHLYIVALGIAPSAEAMADCTAGIEAPTESYLRSRGQ